MTERLSPWDRWIDPEIITRCESGPRATERLKAQARSKRDAAIAEYGPIEEPA